MALKVPRQAAKKSAKKDSESTPTPSWLLRGKDAALALEKRESVREAQEQARDRMYRFYIHRDEDEKTVTFLDGDLIEEDGHTVLDVPHFYEHEVWPTGQPSPSYYVCTSDTEDGDCPLCEMAAAEGRESRLRKYFVVMFTVIDHTTVTYKGKEVEVARKLYPAKTTAHKLLAKAAAKRGGLVGWSLEASRSSDKAPKTGDVFEWDKPDGQSLESLAEEFPNLDVTTPTDYGKEIPYLSPDELRKLGFGAADSPAVGTHAAAPLNESDEVPF